MTDMKRVNNILHCEEYVNNLNMIKQCEKDRKYCKHNLKHFLDVARIAYIINLEKKLCIDKDIIYAAALLHDIGRHEQYINNISHEEASAKIAFELLKDAGYKKDEINIIQKAILEHRKTKNNEKITDKNDENRSFLEYNLSIILYKADKLSRNCFLCKRSTKCNWDDEKKNMDIVI